MAGGDIFSLSKILGHTSVEMTAKRYAALHPQFMKNVAEVVQFDGELSPTVKKDSPYLAHEALSLV